MAQTTAPMPTKTTDPAKGSQPTVPVTPLKFGSPAWRKKYLKK